jgi:hypothetical protein
LQGFRSNLTAGLEVDQLIKIDFVVFNLIDGSESFTTHEWQSAEEWQITALMIEARTATSSGALAFGAPTSGFTLTSRNTAPNAFAILLRSFLRFEIV